MKNGEIYIQYQGFHPSTGTKNFLDNIVHEIHEESPYGSSLKAVISRKDEFFKGTIYVTSAVGPFFAVAAGGDLPQVSKKLLQQMRRRLDKWKSKRFSSHESLRNQKTSGPENEVYDDI